MAQRFGDSDGLELCVRARDGLHDEEGEVRLRAGGLGVEPRLDGCDPPDGGGAGPGPVPRLLPAGAADDVAVSLGVSLLRELLNGLQTSKTWRLATL